jgi:hypothetical protein
VRSRESAPGWAPIARVRRAGAIVIGLCLLIFGVAVLVANPGFFAVHGPEVLGMTGNGLLGVLSVVVGLILIGAGLRGGRLATLATTVFGVLFVLSGIINLSALNTSANKLAFTASNVWFSLVVGIVLVLIGLYGVFGGQYSVKGEELDQDLPEREPGEDAEIREMAAAEHAMAEGTATREQRRMVEADALRRSRERAEAARARYRAQHPDEPA